MVHKIGGQALTMETGSQSEIQTKYQSLMNEYVRLLKLAASGKVGWMTKQVIEDHIRIILNEITEAFTLLEYSAQMVDQDYATWLHEQVEYLVKLAGQLANIKQQVFKFAWRGLTLLFALVVSLAVGNDAQPGNAGFLLSHWRQIIITLSGVYSLLFLVWSLGFGMAGIRQMAKKRTYFKPGYDLHDYPLEAGNHTLEGVNVYRVENECFDSLARKKPLEQPWDAWGALLLVVVGFILFPQIFLIGYMLSLSLNLSDSWKLLVSLEGSFLFMGFLIYNAFVRNAFKRER
jgi:hypothetical protein